MIIATRPRALKKTEALWPALSQAYALVHQAAHVLANHEDESGQAVRERYQAVLLTMREQQASLGALSEAISTFLKVTESYWSGLFHCYDVADLPRTNNELEHCFGSVRYSERRASGRRGAIAALVVRGPVRVLTALALRRQCFLPRALLLKDPDAWYAMREHLAFRREAHRKQLRFRKDPAAYLAALEEVLVKMGFPVLDRLLIAPGGAFDGFLHAVAHLAHQIATMIGMIAHPKLSFERHCQSAAIPDLSSKSIGWRSFGQHCWDVCLLLCRQTRRRSFRRMRFEGFFCGGYLRYLHRTWRV